MVQLGYKVSVLVSVYEAEPYIERCARSLFEQTYSNLEYVFVDDCTPDKSMEILKRVMADYPDRGAAVRMIHHEQNKGLAAVRNTAFDNATGEFICVVDSDDWMELDAIEKLVARQVATDADVVWGKALMHKEGREVVLYEPKYKDLEEWRTHYFRFSRNYVMVNWTRFIRRSLMEQNHIRHEEGPHIGNDKQLMPLIAYYAKSFSWIDDIVYHYERRNPNARTYKAVVKGEFELFAYTREVESMRRVVRFLADKEPHYLETAESAKLERLLEYRKMALKEHSRKGFRIMCDWIMETPVQYRELIGWNDSFKTRFMTNYVFSLLKTEFHTRNLERATKD